LPVHGGEHGGGPAGRKAADRAAPTANNESEDLGMSVLRGRFVDVNAHSEFPLQAGVAQPRAASRNGIGLDDNVYQALLQNRIIFLGSEVRDENANAICAQMLLLNAEDPDADIFLYINSPGGSVDAGMAIYDTMNYISNDVATVGMGLAASMGQFLLCAGAKGKRYALPHARIMMHQPSGGMGGSASDIKIQAQQSLHIKKILLELISEHTGQPIDQVIADADRDRWFTAEQAKDYGFIDNVISSARQVADEGRPARNK
jgi:ATP-dependent Clp protease protease subunit